MERSGLERFGDGGMMLLPWTKQILSVVWEHLRLLVQVICCTVMTVFQMFRFEVHVRITDETGQHIQHLTNGPGDSPEGFLISSLFENNIASSSPLSKFSSDPFDVSSHSRAVLSSLVNEELCCSLVDDLVSHANADGLFHDWTLVGGAERNREKNSCSFTAHVAAFSPDFTKQQNSCSFFTQDVLTHLQSDSESSWGSTDSSGQEDADGLWDLLTRSTDPYHPMHFTACLSSSSAEKPTVPSRPHPKAERASVSSSKSASEDEEEALWKSLSQNDDPYHPLNFRAPLQSLVPLIKPVLSSRHRRPVETFSIVPWRRRSSVPSAQAELENQPVEKKVRFSPTVRVHQMRAWSFALQRSRKGPWEELARDRDRFQKRIGETEKAIGYCLSPSHRESRRMK